MCLLVGVWVVWAVWVGRWKTKRADLMLNRPDQGQTNKGQDGRASTYPNPYVQNLPYTVQTEKEETYEDCTVVYLMSCSAAARIEGYGKTAPWPTKSMRSAIHLSLGLFLTYRRVQQTRTMQ